MASSLVFKRLVCSNILTSSFFRSVRPAAASSASRFFNTNAVRNFDDHEESDMDFDRRRDSRIPRRGDFLLDAFDPFSPTRSLSQVLNLVDQFANSPILSASPGAGAGLHRGWDAKETEDALNLRIDMPGLGKEDVNVSVEQNTLVIKGEGAADSDEEKAGRRYTSRIELPDKVFKTDRIKAEMKNGVLKVVVPKVKEEDRKDVVHVTVE